MPALNTTTTMNSSVASARAEPLTINGLTVRQILVKAAQQLAAENNQTAFWLIRTVAEHANEVEQRVIADLMEKLKAKERA